MCGVCDATHGWALWAHCVTCQQYTLYMNDSQCRNCFVLLYTVRWDYRHTGSGIFWIIEIKLVTLQICFWCLIFKAEAKAHRYVAPPFRLKDLTYYQCLYGIYFRMCLLPTSLNKANNWQKTNEVYHFVFHKTTAKTWQWNCNYILSECGILLWWQHLGTN